MIQKSKNKAAQQLARHGHKTHPRGEEFYSNMAKARWKKWREKQEKKLSPKSI